MRALPCRRQGLGVRGGLGVRYNPLRFPVVFSQHGEEAAGTGSGVVALLLGDALQDAPALADHYQAPLCQV